MAIKFFQTLVTGWHFRVVAIALSSAWVTIGSAQSSSGMFGSSRGTSGTISSAQSNFGGGSAFGSGAGGAGAAGATTASQQGAGQIDGNERALQGGFVGAGTSSNFFSQMNITGTQQGRQQGTTQNQFRTSGQNNRQGNSQFGGGNQSQQSTLRRRLNASPLQASRPQPATIAGALGKRVTALAQTTSSPGEVLTRAPRISSAASVQLSVEGQTATLRGTVTSEYERRLLEQMARLEPGIWTVRNELTLSTEPSDSPTLPLPPAAQ